METTLPRAARLPINRCNLPASILGSLTFQRHPMPLKIDGVEELHAMLFRQLNDLCDATARRDAFLTHMKAAFSLDHPEDAGHGAGGMDRSKASYLRVLRGWSFDADGREAAVLKGWVESRFGLLPRHHAGPIRDMSGDAYRFCLGQRSSGLYNTNSLEAQLDVLFAWCQHELARQWPGCTHLCLYRGVNRLDDHETLAAPRDRHRTLLLNNLNSFSRDRERAGEFGDHVLQARVPLSKIAFFDALLPGRLAGEGEHAVIGGVYEVEILTD